MSNGMDEGYEMPSDLKHASKPLWGLSVLHFCFLIAGVLIMGIWWKLITFVGFSLNSMIFKLGIILIIAFVACLIFFELDRWIYLGVKYITRPYRFSRIETECKAFIGIYGIEGDYYYNRYGDVCSIIKLISLNSNRVDPDKLDIVEANDKKFLNALPCPIQIVGYSTSYNLDDYYKSMLKYAQRLPSKTKSMLIAHLDYYTEYCDNLEINEKNIYMIVTVKSGTARPLDTLNLNTGIIQNNLIPCGVAGVRLTETEISNLVITTTTGIGNEGIDYLNLFTDVE